MAMANSISIFWKYDKKSLYKLKPIIQAQLYITGQLVQTKNIRFGFRTVELIQNPIPPKGHKF